MEIGGNGIGASDSDQDRGVRWSRFVGGLGRTLIGVGVLLLLFVAYQLWGTGLHEARAQRRLTGEFERALDAVEPARSPRATTTLPPALPGDAVAILRIPAIGLERTVVEGVGVADLKQGPGHYPQTPLPGQPGNAAIAGHRTTYGAPFYDLDELEPGDDVLVRTLQGEFTYEVSTTDVVAPSETGVLAPTEDGRLTLTTCEPRFSARKRLVVTALLRDRPAPTTTTTTPSPGEPDDDALPAFEEAGLSGDPAARWPAFWWGSLAALVGIATALVARRWRRVWAYVIGTPVFLVVLFVFFENVARLLPANV